MQLEPTRHGVEQGTSAPYEAQTAVSCSVAGLQWAFLVFFRGGGLFFVVVEGDGWALCARESAWAVVVAMNV